MHMKRPKITSYRPLLNLDSRLTQTRDHRRGRRDLTYAFWREMKFCQWKKK